jgi:hypothetical protein
MRQGEGMRSESIDVKHLPLNAGVNNKLRPLS